MSLSSSRRKYESRRRIKESICVSVYGRNISELNRNVERALSFSPGYVEVRLDYLRPVPEKEIQLSKVRRCRNEIFTLRSWNEGGVSNVSDHDRSRILSDIISEISTPFVDVEMRTLDSFPEITEKLDTSRASNLIASSHDFNQSESTRQLEKLLFRCVERYSPSIVKIVRQAIDFDDNRKILSLYNISRQIKPTKLVAFCSGSLGVFSRIACVSLGSPFTFASLPNKCTAPGQLDIVSLKTILSSWGTNQR